jgi:hypothetical protein
MRDKFEKFSKEAGMVYRKYYSGICLEGLRKTRKYLSHDSRYPYRNSNRTLHDCYRYANRLSFPLDMTSWELER